MPGNRGRQRGQKIDSRMLGTVGIPTLQRKLRADLARCKIEACRRKADALLAEAPANPPNSVSVSPEAEVDRKDRT